MEAATDLGVTLDTSLTFDDHITATVASMPGGGGVLPIMAYTGRLRPKEVPFSGFRYKKG